jgi:phosphate-selective porin
MQIGRVGSFTNVADIRFDTWGVGYAYQINPFTRLIFYYDLVRNEATQFGGYQKDIKDNIFTCRFHFRF